MARSEWVPVKKIWCDRIGGEAQLLEQWVYPEEIMPDTAPYRVVGRKCSTGLECNIAGAPCKWSYINPDHDPFV